MFPYYSRADIIGKCDALLILGVILPKTITFLSNI